MGGFQRGSSRTVPTRPMPPRGAYRRGHDGPRRGIVRNTWKLNPFDGHLFVFLGTAARVPGSPTPSTLSSVAITGPRTQGHALLLRAAPPISRLPCPWRAERADVGTARARDEAADDTFR